jgi:hypothetical protein
MVNVDDVLDGDLEEIIESILKSGAVKWKNQLNI